MEELDFILFDKFRHLGRMMRMGRSPGEMQGSGFPERHCAPGAELHEFPPRPKRDGVHHRDIVLGVLDLGGRPMRAKEIAGEIHVSPSTLSEMVKRLEGDGLIERMRDPDDHRAVMFELTGEGRKRAAVMRGAHEAIVRYMFRNLSDSDKQEMIRLFDLILQP